jgi:hypothetical protein
MRLSANLAHKPTPHTTSHPSPYLVIVQLSEWELGGAKIVLSDMGILIQMVQYLR